MKVFSEDFCQDVRKYERLSEHLRPVIYELAILDNWQELRNDIEKMFAMLSSIDQEKLVIRLRLERNDQRLHAYNELAIGYLLCRAGYSVEYEKIFRCESGRECTPDWYSSVKDKTPEFIIDVFSTSFDSSDENQRLQTQISDLESRLRNINVDSVLEIFLDYDAFNPNNEKFNRNRNNQIFKNVKQWLEQNAPCVGLEYSEEYFECKIVEQGNGFSSLYPVISPQVYRIDSLKLHSKIVDKVSKYKKLGLPLIVAPFTDAGLMVDFLERGKLNALFLKNPDLSALILVECYDALVDSWGIKVVHNSIATNPLPLDFLGGQLVESSEAFKVVDVEPISCPESSLRSLLLEGIEAGFSGAKTEGYDQTV